MAGGYDLGSIIAGVGQAASRFNPWAEPEKEFQAERDFSGGILGPWGQAFSSGAGSSPSFVDVFDQARNNDIFYQQAQQKLRNLDQQNQTALQGNRIVTPAAGGGSVGAFPYADLVQQYTPDDLKNDPEFARIVAAGAKAESGWDPRRVQAGGGGRGLFQFDTGGMGKGFSDEQLFDPAFQAQRIVPLYAQAYRNRASSGFTNPADIASWVAAQAERPLDYQNPNSAARQNYVQAYNSINSTPGPTAQPTGQGDWIQQAQGMLGRAYVWGGKDPKTGFDCSGFVGWTLGTGQPESTISLYQKSRPVIGEPQVGDLVFYNMNSRDMHVQHVARYIGNGQIIQAGGIKRSINIASVNQPVGSAPEFRRA